MKRSTVLAIAVAVPAAMIASDSRTQPAQLDICEYEVTFAEDFDELSVSPWDATEARWIAHTPWYGDFGDAVFADPEPGFPFTVEDGVLRIEARKDEDGSWRSGLLSSVDPQTNGFSQMYGYFEARMKLPPGPGLWPAFWLGTNEPRDRREPSLEVDVIEHYGHSPAAFQASLHVWHKTEGGVRSDARHQSVQVPTGSLYDRFNLYGVDVREDEIVFYLNREEIWRLPTPPEHLMPLFPLVNLALGSGFPIDETPSPSVMEVDYIHVFRHDPEGRDARCSE